MSDSLISGISGLNAEQQMLNVVGDNLANLNTTGFKEQRASFEDVLYDTISGGSAPTTTMGGTNPMQVGSGTAVAAIASNEQQGSLNTTGNPFDLALQGDGFFVVNGDSQQLFTRDGSFHLDANGNLVDAQGDFVQRYGSTGEGTSTTPAFQQAGVTNINIPLGSGIPGQATSTITLQGNLSASAGGPQAEVLTSGTPFQSGGAAATGATLLNNLSDNVVPYAAGDTIVLQGTTASGAAVNSTFAVGPTTTLSNLVSDINSAFPGSTASISSTGNLVVQANTTGPSQLSLTITDSAGDHGSSDWGAHSIEVSTPGQNGATYTSAIQFYDTQGTAHNLSLTFQKQGNNTWNLTGAISPNDGTVTSGTISGITFNANGSFQQASGATSMTFQINGLAQPQTINFNLGTTGGFTGLTQFGGSSSAAATGQDGYGPGSLTNVSIGQDGLITGVFSNGKTFPVAQLAIAGFTNASGLLRVGNNDYSASGSSGQPMIGAGASGSRGAVQQGSLESSNVDVALEFTKLIQAQSGYEVNSRSISISSQVLQDLANIIH